jgi:hypothetical protein
MAGTIPFTISSLTALSHPSMKKVCVMVQQTYNVATPKRKKIKSALHSMEMMI